MKGSQVLVTVDPELRTRGDANTVWVDYPNIVRVVPVGGRIYIDDGLISLVVKEIGAHEPPVLVLRSGPPSFRSRLRPSLPPNLPEPLASRLLGCPGLGLDWRVRSFFTDVHPALFGAEPRLSVKKQIRHHSVFLRVQARCPHCCDYAPGLTPNLGGLFPYPQVQKG